MRTFVHSFLLIIFAGMVGMSMLSAGEHPIRVLLIIGGICFFMLRANAIHDRSRLRIGKPLELVSTFTSTVEDLGAMTRRDWKDLGITAAVALGLILVGAFVFRTAA